MALQPERSSEVSASIPPTSAGSVVMALQPVRSSLLPCPSLNVTPCHSWGGVPSGHLSRSASLAPRSSFNASTCSAVGGCISFSRPCRSSPRACRSLTAWSSLSSSPNELSSSSLSVTNCCNSWRASSRICDTPSSVNTAASAASATSTVAPDPATSAAATSDDAPPPQLPLPPSPSSLPSPPCVPSPWPRAFTSMTESSLLDVPPASALGGRLGSGEPEPPRPRSLTSMVESFLTPQLESAASPSSRLPPWYSSKVSAGSPERSLASLCRKPEGCCRLASTMTVWPFLTSTCTCTGAIWTSPSEAVSSLSPATSSEDDRFSTAAGFLRSSWWSSSSVS